MRTSSSPSVSSSSRQPQSPAHWPDFGPETTLGTPTLIGAGTLPAQDSDPLMWLPETTVEPVLFCTATGPRTVVGAHSPLGLPSQTRVAPVTFTGPDTVVPQSRTLSAPDAVTVP